MKRILIVAFILFIAFGTLAQEQHPNLERGFSAEKVYDYADIDNVNLFDGSLKVTIPIGPSFHVNGALSYGLTLSYNNQLWDLEPGEVTLWPEGQPPVTIPHVKAFPTERSNAGPGWVLSLGKIYGSGTEYNSGSKWHYEGPDGRDHEIGDLDHVGDVDYSRDNTFIRAKRKSVTEVTLEFPGGEIQTFDRYSTDDWRLRERRDRFGNAVWIEYSANGDTWTIKDGHREHKIYFVSQSYYNAYGNRLVDRVVLAGFNGATHEYKFNYESATFITSCEYKEGLVSGPTSFTRPFLKSVLLPDGSSWEMKYSNSAGTPATNCDQGSLTSLRMPTHGTIRWTYVKYELTTTQCSGSFLGMASAVPGVGTRALLDENLADGGRVTTYTPVRSTPVQFSGCAQSYQPSEYVSNTVRRPDGARTIHYFSLWHETSVSPNGYRAIERGLPYRRLPDGRMLSEEFLGNCSGPNCPALRSTYVGWEFERSTNPNDVRSHYNARQKYAKNVMNDDGGRFIEKSLYRYDGVGHFRMSMMRSDIGGKDRSETTEYDATSGDMTVDANGFTITDVVRPAADQPWLLDTYTHKYTEENGTHRESTYCFEKTTGFLLRRRTHANGSNDLLAVYAHTLEGSAQNGKGNLLREQYYGGDDQALDTASAICQMPLPTAGPKYTILHEYAFGTRKSSKYENGTFKLLDLTIDANTGLPKESRDVAGLLTTLDYDPFGRMKEMRPPERARTQYVYDTTSQPSRTTIQTLPPAGSTALTDTRVYFDAFGRVMQRRERMPAGWSTTNITYDAMGRQQTASAPEYRTSEAYENAAAFTPAHAWISAYDIYGRLSSATNPDASSTTYQYTGERERKTTSFVATELGQPDREVTSTEQYDYQKRLIKVVEKSGPGNGTSPEGTEAAAEYAYNVGHQVTAVKMTAPDGIVQNRIFDYDGRGLLRWESHPESGMTAYTYDARGHVLTKRQGAANTPFDLNYQYDGAERLMKVESRDPQNTALFRPLKEFEFGTANASGDLRQGKLVRAARYNYRPEGIVSFPGAIVRVTETFAYKDPAGALTDRTTTIATSFNGTIWQEARSIAQAVIYDVMGLPSEMLYPMCVNCGTPPGDPWRRIGSIYSYGRLTSLVEAAGNGYQPSFVNSISYAANGMRSAVRHSNSMEDTLVPDASGMPRPGMMKSEVYKPCQAPVITSQTLGAVRDFTTGAVQLQVTATGAPPLRYAWYDATNYPPVLMATNTTSIEVGPTTTSKYYVDVINDCRTVRSETMTVKYGACVEPWIHKATATRNPNGSFTLSVSAFGAGTLNYTWRRVSDNAIVGTIPTMTTGVLSNSAQYAITVTNQCGGAGASSTVSADVPITVAPMTVSASQISTAQLNVTWSSVPGVSSYTLERRAGTEWTTVTTGTFTQYTDSAVSVDKAYAYRVKAYNANGAMIGESAADIAATIAFTAVTTGMTVSAAPLEELLRGVNAVRSLSGWSNVTWSNILSAEDSLPDPGMLILARHLLAIRVRLNEAMHALGVPASGYTDSDVQGLIIAAAHIAEIQNRLR